MVNAIPSPASDPRTGFCWQLVTDSPVSTSRHAHETILIIVIFPFAWPGVKEAFSHESRLRYTASRKALELAPELAEAHSARGYALTLKGDFTAAAAEFERALQLEPKNYEALYLFGRSCFAEGKMEQAAALFAQAHEAQPDEFQAISLRESALRSLGLSDEHQEGLEQAVDAIRQRLELNPEDQRALHLGCSLLVSAGEVEQGLDLARKLLKLASNDPGALYNATCAFANAGRTDEAIELLGRRVELGGLYREWVEHDPDLAALRNNPRFEALLERMSSPRSSD